MIRKATRVTGIRALLVGLLAVVVVQVGQSREAQAQPAIDAVLGGGIQDDGSTVMYRLLAGGMYALPAFPKLAAEAHLSFEGFLRLDSDEGVAARSISLLDIGVRYGIKDKMFRGPYVSAGGSFGIFFGSPHERKVVNEPDVCETASAGANQNDCTYRINKSLAGRFGLGWGFKSGKNTTVGVRVDFNYWMYSLNDGEDQAPGAPNPNKVPRPQRALAVVIGLEFMRWR